MLALRRIRNAGAAAMVIVGSLAVSAPASAGGAERPGNVFIAGEEVRAAVPAAWTSWQAVDFDGKQVARGVVRDGAAELGKLPVGYFEIRSSDPQAEKTTAAVVPRVIADAQTPIALDAAVSWFYSDEKQIRDACKLARMAGVTWVRDRASWAEIQTARGTWAAETRYERAMRIEHEMGLKILQVNHISPAWAATDPKRFPDDLRDVFDFYRGLAKRWKGLADAIEPWNEPDIEPFGAHTGCEIASFQKAAYLGLKAGDPGLPVNAAVFAIDRAQTLDEFGVNDVWPYFDRYDLHHYIRLPEYPRAYGRHRATSGGRPMWTTEFNLPVHWADVKTKEPSDEELHFQAYRVGKVFAQALHEGTEKAFYFILGDYVERNIQYGIIHRDLTPRPAYVAFAAVGRLMNDAKPIGRVDLGDEKLKAYAFATRVDGVDRETVIAWSETNPTPVEIPAAEMIYDYLGRDLPLRAGKIELGRETIFFLLPSGGSKSLRIIEPPAKPKWRDGRACPLVLQLIGRGDVKRSAFVLNDAKELKLLAYNFGNVLARGKLHFDGATGAADDLEIGPGDRVERTIKTSAEKVTVRLDLGENGATMVSARVTTAPPATQP